MIRQPRFALTSKPRNKFGAVKVSLDGHTFDSRAEAAVYCELKLLQRGGHLTDLTVHPKYELVVEGVKIASYTADFSFREEGRTRVIDVKGKPTAARRDFKLVRSLMKAVHGIDVEIWTDGINGLWPAAKRGRAA